MMVHQCNHDLQHPLHHRHPLLHVVCLQNRLLQVPCVSLVWTSLVLVQARLTSSEGFTVLELDEYELVSDLNQVFLGLLENQRNLKKEGRDAKFAVNSKLIVVHGFYATVSRSPGGE